MKRLLLLLLLTLTAACAPIATLRTPQPLEAGQSRFSLGMTLPILLYNTPIPWAPCREQSPCEGSPLPLLGYSPAPQMQDFRWDFGMGGNSDLNFSLLLVTPAARLGGKTLVLDDAIKLGLDYGLGLYFAGLVADVGLLWSIPADGWEPYGSFRAYVASWKFQYPSFSTSLGVALPVGNGRWFLELSLVGSRADYNGQFVWGWSPAIGYRF